MFYQRASLLQEWSNNKETIIIVRVNDSGTHKLVFLVVVLVLPY